MHTHSRTVFTGNIFLYKKGLPAAVMLALLTVLFSCTSTKRTAYFQDIPADTALSNLVSKNYEPIIRKGDLLGITVSSLSPDNTLLYNAPQNVVGPTPGYLVDENGDIFFFKLGTVHAEGLTRKELKEKLQNDLTPYLAQNVVSVSFQNRHITLMGPLNSQVIPLVNDNTTILDVLATGGDIADKGRTDNVLVIRESDDHSKTFKRINLTDKSVFYSPYFYVQPNDVVYVEPVKKKPENATRIVSYITAGLSVLVFILDRIIK